ncbi:MAG TPA: ion transporter [Acidimicrobiales bacterium]
MGPEPSPEQSPLDDDRVLDHARSPEARARLQEHERRIYIPLLLSALLPIVVAASRAATDSRVSIVVNVVAWFVFVYDLFVHVRLERHYLRSKVGVFDLVIVVITAPWFLLPGFGGSQILVLARLARLVRLFFVSKSARQLGRRLGGVGLFSVAMLLFCSWMAYVADHPTNPEFATFGDSLWWGVVTLTTVGYGDIVPETQKGRLAGVFLMLTGIATLGVISGTLASAFRSSRASSDEAGTDEPTTGDTPPGADLQAELADLRVHLTALEQHVATLVERSNPPSA